MLEPGQPLPLAEGLALHAPEELDALLQAHPQRRQALLDALQQRVEDGRLAEWLRAGEFPDTGRVLKLLDDCQRRYPGEPRLRAYAVYWFYTCQFAAKWRRRRVCPSPTPKSPMPASWQRGSPAAPPGDRLA